MAALPQEQLTLRAGMRQGLLALLALVPMASGCVLLDKFDSKGPPPPGNPCQIAAFWQNHVVFSPDPTRNGAPGAGLAGRVYLFGPQIDFPMTGDGSLVADLFEQKDGKDEMVEQWRLDPETFHRLLKQDRLGWGYTVFLPWSAYGRMCAGETTHPLPAGEGSTDVHGKRGHTGAPERGDQARFDSRDAAGPGEVI